MTTPKKITQKEFHDFIETQMIHEFTPVEREAIKDAFTDSLHDVDYEESRPFFGKPMPGITKKEIEENMAKIRDKNSDFSKNSKAQLWQHPAKLDKLEEWLNQAEEGDKERRWF